jgi:hypothetical protein
MIDLMLRADCTRCAALCCVSLAFDRSELFAFDKPADEACLNLTSNHCCRIHAHLEQRGFSGCTRYDCSGAGQRVTQELFQGRSWRDHPSLARTMFEAFRAMREVHELLLLLNTSNRLPLTPEQAQRRKDLVALLQPPHGWSPKSLSDFDRSQLSNEVHLFLRTLRNQAPHDELTRRRLRIAV